MSNRIANENRDSSRKRLLKGGYIAFSARHATLPCVVRDISESGARLQVGQVSSVPDTFELIVELDGLEVPCVVVWRKANEIGVTFTASPTYVAPRRAQIVGVRSPNGGKPTLRRNSPVAATAATDAPDGMSALSFSSPKAMPAATPQATIPILIADDDPDDRLLIADAFKESNYRHPIEFVNDGEELLNYLRGGAPFAQRVMPGLVLLDLNMPRMDGRTALMHIKTDPVLKRIPVIVLTTSNAEEDVRRTYELGVSAFMPKPSSFDGLIDLVRALDNYWMRFVLMPAA